MRWLTSDPYHAAANGERNRCAEEMVAAIPVVDLNRKPPGDDSRSVADNVERAADLPGWHETYPS
jgi:hypothetical protein